MSEQLQMLVLDGKLTPRGPVWKWWLGDREHWVANPDRVLRVADIPDDHLANILVYLSKWSENRVQNLMTSWLHRMGYFSPRTNQMSDASQTLIDMEIRLLYEQTARQWMELYIVPALPRLEEEAVKRGIPVPAIPGFDDPRVTRAAAATAWLAQNRVRPLSTPEPQDLPRRRHNPSRTCRTCNAKGHDSRNCPKRNG